MGIKGGDKFDAALSAIEKRIQANTVQVGWPEGATYPDKAGTPVAYVASIHEFGASSAGIPPRPFFRPMIAAKSPDWGKVLGHAMAVSNNDSSIALGLLGEEIKGELFESIIGVTSPPLSPVTLMLKKMKSADQSLVVTGKIVGEAAARVAAGESPGNQAAKPLVDTGHMLNSIWAGLKE